jgi:hypothetical protein
MSMHRFLRLGRSIAGRATLAVALVATSAIGVQAQSNLSVQGFGFPTGQLSTHAQGAGGSTGEMDPLSPINPSAIAVFNSRILYFQVEPEYRKVSTGNGTEATTTARYPNVFGALPIGHFVFSLGASTLLDRTATTSFKSTQFLSGGDSVPMTTTERVDGAMDDVRLAAGWAPATWLRLGIGGHAIVGHNLVTLSQAFTDSTTFNSFSQSRVLGFSGAAMSAGFQLLSNSWVASASARHGWNMNVAVGDTVLSRGKVPDRYGASLAYTGLTNSAFTVRTSHDSWSSLGSLGSPGLVAVDAWDTSVGADVAGPKFGDQLVFLRAGYRDRILPFEAAGQKVTEKSFSAGLGTGFASGRILGDLAVIHASRTAAIAASEKAWTISLGIAVRP